MEKSQQEDLTLNHEQLIIVMENHAIPQCVSDQSCRDFRPNRKMEKYLEEQSNLLDSIRTWLSSAAEGINDSHFIVNTSDHYRFEFVATDIGKTSDGVRKFHLQLFKKNSFSKQELQNEKAGTIGHRLMRVIAHEVRNPLTNISLAAESIDAQQISEEDLSMLDMIKRNVARIRQLMEELLYHEGKPPLAIEEHSLEDLLAAATSMSEGLLKTNNMYLNAEIPETLLSVRFDMDISLLSKAISHILKNAIQASKSGDFISIIGKESDAGIELSIRDKGDGFDPRMLDKVFDPYFSTREQNTGLGLASAKQIIEAHCGRVKILTPEVQQGAEVAVYLPLSLTTGATL